MNKFKIGVVGNGFVGRATALFKCKDIEVVIFDKDKSKSDVEKISDLNDCDAVFICVPTPMNKDGGCNTSIVESVIKDLKQTYKGCIVVRSTVPVGFCEKYQVAFMPEFLTERNWKDDFKNTSLWILGTDKNVPDFKLENLLLTAMASNSIKSINNIIISQSEAELVKYTRNCFLALKVSYFNEIYDLCKAKGMNYNDIAVIAGFDSRIGVSHTMVPGLDGKRGFGGTCLPKDLNSLIYQFAENGLKSPILNSVLIRNEQIDRPEKDWLLDVGRVV